MVEYALQYQNYHFTLTTFYSQQWGENHDYMIGSGRDGDRKEILYANGIEEEICIPVPALLVATTSISFAVKEMLEKPNLWLIGIQGLSVG